MEQYLIIVGLLAVGLVLCGVWYEVRQHRNLAMSVIAQATAAAAVHRQPIQPPSPPVPPAPAKSAAMVSLEALHDKVDVLTSHLDTVDAVNELHHTIEDNHAKLDGALRNAAASMSSLHEKVDSVHGRIETVNAKVDALAKPIILPDPVELQKREPIPEPTAQVVAAAEPLKS